MENQTTAVTPGLVTPGQLHLDTKLTTILREFVLGRNMNRFEAEAHHDHCLHSTVSTLQNGYGIKIDRMFEVVPCVRGRLRVRCTRYWLDTCHDNLVAARRLLGQLERGQQ